MSPINKKIKRVQQRIKVKNIKDLDPQELQDLLIDAAKNWLAHDGLWFRAVEEKFGIETALDLDKREIGRAHV